MAGKKGVPFCPGGKREGAGRKPSEFLAKCREIAGSPKFLKWAADVINGEDVETKITIDGKAVKVPAATDDRSKLWEKIAAYGFGKPVQALEHSGKDGGPITLAELISKNAD